MFEGCQNLTSMFGPWINLTNFVNLYRDVSRIISSKISIDIPLLSSLCFTNLNFGALFESLGRLLHPFRPVSPQGISRFGCAAQAVQLGTAAAPAHGGRLDPGACPWPCGCRIPVEVLGFYS